MITGAPDRRTILAAAHAALLLLPSMAVAQSSVRYLDADSWASPIAEYLIRAGILRDPDPLTRPLRRADLARSIAEVDTATVAPRLLAMLRQLGVELAETEAPVRWTLEPHAGFLAASDASRWTLRPVTDSSFVAPQVGIGAALELPHFAIVVTPALDNRLRGDPTYFGRKDRFIAGRATHGYVTARWRYAELFFGATNRNWGPTATEGLMISASPYSEEHLALRLGPDRLRLEVLAQQLDAVVPWDSSPALGRWLVSHRLVARPSRTLWFSLEESVIAPGAALPWRYLNPAALALLTQVDDGPPANSMLGASVAWQATRSTRLFAQLMLDDIQLDRAGLGDNEPTAYGLTLGGSGGLAGGGATWTAYYTRVANLAYRTPNNEDQYTLNSVGLARNQSDYDQLSLRLEAPAPRHLLVGIEAHAVRQGEGDIRLRYPPVAAFADSLAFLTGVVQRTVQLAATASWTPRRDATLSTYLGLAAYRNAGHVAGVSDSRVIWRLQATLRRRFTGALPTDAF